MPFHRSGRKLGERIKEERTVHCSAGRALGASFRAEKKKSPEGEKRCVFQSVNKRGSKVIFHFVQRKRE